MILAMTRKDNRSLQISDDAMQAVNRMLAVYDVRISKKDLIEQLILWADQQSDVVKGSILGTIPPSARVNVARMELERMFTPPASAPTVPTAADQELENQAERELELDRDRARQHAAKPPLSNRRKIGH